MTTIHPLVVSGAFGQSGATVTGGGNALSDGSSATYGDVSFNNFDTIVIRLDGDYFTIPPGATTPNARLRMTIDAEQIGAGGLGAGTPIQATIYLGSSIGGPALFNILLNSTGRPAGATRETYTLDQDDASNNGTIQTGGFSDFANIAIEGGYITASLAPGHLAIAGFTRIYEVTAWLEWDGSDYGTTPVPVPPLHQGGRLSKAYLLHNRGHL